MNCRFGSSREQGSAALEAMLLLVFMIVPMWMLLFNMGYNGVRHRQAQAALRTGAFLYVDNLGSQERTKASTSAENTVNSLMFKGEEGKQAVLTFSGQQDQPDAARNADTEGILAGMSSRQSVGIAVKRKAPYENLFKSDTDLKGKLILGANTWTFCEMKDDDFGGGMTALNGLSLVGDYGLWLFGGCGGGVLGGCGNKCDE